MKKDEMKSTFIGLLHALVEVDEVEDVPLRRLQTDKDGFFEIRLSEKVLRENNLSEDTFWDIVCPLLKKEGVLKSYNDPENFFSDFQGFVYSHPQYTAITGNLLHRQSPYSDAEKAKFSEVEMKLRESYHHTFLVDKEKLLEWIKVVTDSAPLRNKKRVTLPKFPRTEWSKVSITFFDDREVTISDGIESKPTNFAGLDFEDRRNGKPDASWKFLLDIAKNNGESEVMSKDERETKKKYKQKITDTLRKIFQNQTDPFEDSFGTKTYKALFQITPPSSETKSDSIYGE